MRSIVIGLALMLVTIPAAHAQQLATPTAAPTSETDLRRVEAPTAALAVDLAPADVDQAAVPIQEVEARHTVAETKAAAQVSARNVLAIIGAVVVVVALVALFS